MHLKTLLVCLTTPDHAETLLKVAVPLARRHNAHLIGLHTLEALEVYPGIAMHVSAQAFGAFNASQKEQAESIRAAFDAATRNEDFVCEYRLLKAQSKTAADRLVESARAADLVIMSQADKATDRFDQHGAQRAVIQQSGRPVIVVPLGYEGPEIGRRCVLGWSETREAARAAHDLVGVADEGADIIVLRVRKGRADEMRDADMIDLSATLARHGFNVDLRHIDRAGQSISDILMDCAFEAGADMMATGAFGHSTAYDFVLGATSQSLLRNARLPVLFSK
ncbi:MAG: universal stress protein [Pseudomonadota bacterium]